MKILEDTKVLAATGAPLFPGRTTCVKHTLASADPAAG
jgi:hypothetical protein